MKILIFIFLVFFLLSCSTTPSRHPTSIGIDEIASGLPTNIASSKMDELSFVPVKTKRLSKARVVWFNFELAREKGLEIPAEGMTPEFEKQLLDQFGYMVPNKNSNPDLFLEKEKTFHADIYGGAFIAGNGGSGRAASTGSFQIKGVGITPLVDPNTNFDHAHGGASFQESITEAIWGEINHRELPVGGNRVLLIIDSGDFTPWNDGGKEPRALIVREDPIRPAHFMTNKQDGVWAKTEAERIKKMISILPNVLPYPASIDPLSLPKGKRIAAGLDEMVDRFAKQYAAAHARKIFHAACSPSNIEITGRFLDYGTETSLSGFGKAKVLKFGNDFTTEIDEHAIPTFNELLKNIRQFGDLDTEDLKDLPTFDQLEVTLNNRYQFHKQNEFLKLTGFPSNIVEQYAHQNEGRALYKELEWLLSEGNESFVDVDKSMPPQMGKYDIGEIFKILLNQNHRPIESMANSLPATISQERRVSIATAYSDFFKQAVNHAKEEGVDKEALIYLIGLNIEQKNRKLPDLYRQKLHDDNVALVDDYLKNHNRSLLWDSINNRVSKSTITYKTSSPYQIVVKEIRSAIDGASERLVYDAKKKTYFISIESSITGDEVNFFGHKIALDDFKNSKMRFTLNGWADAGEISPKINHGKVEFMIPIDKESGQVDYAIRSADSSYWWKKGSENFSFKFPQIKYRKSNNSTNNCFELLTPFLF